MRDILRDLFLSCDRGRSLLRSLAWFVPIAAITLYSHSDIFTGTKPATGTAHPEQSINVALNAAYCGKPQLWSARHSPQSFLTTRPDLMSAPLRNVISAMAGSLDTYCQSVNEP